MQKKTKTICSLIAVVTLVLFSSFVIRKDDTKTVKTIVIDAGHGGKDPGCNGASAFEKDVTLAVALKLGKLIEDNIKDVKVIYTRETDVFVELEERAQIANRNNADLFISIHCNAAATWVTYKDKKGKKRRKEVHNPKPFGSETYVMGIKNEAGKANVAQRENSAILLEDDYKKKYQGFDPNSEESYIIMSNYTSAYVLRSASIAVKIQEEYSKKAGRIDKGVKRESLWVLWRTTMPSILTEIGYLTNPLEESFLSSEKGQNSIASALFRAFRRYKDEVEGKKKEYTDAVENTEVIENENIKAQKDSLLTKQTDKKKETVLLLDTTKNIMEHPLVEKPDTANKQDEKVVSKEDLIKNYKDKQKLKTDSISKKESIKHTNATTPKIEFRVQFAVSDKELNLKEEKYKQIESIQFYKLNNMFKYTSGNYPDMPTVLKQQKKLKELGYNDCFIIAFKNGERIDLNEAKKLAGTVK